MAGGGESNPLQIIHYSDKAHREVPPRNSHWCNMTHCSVCKVGIDNKHTLLIVTTCNGDWPRMRTKLLSHTCWMTAWMACISKKDVLLLHLSLVLKCCYDINRKKNSKHIIKKHSKKKSFSYWTVLYFNTVLLNKLQPYFIFQNYRKMLFYWVCILKKMVANPIITRNMVVYLFIFRAWNEAISDMQLIFQMISSKFYKTSNF